MTALYRGGNRYELVFEEFSERLEIARQHRQWTAPAAADIEHRPGTQLGHKVDLASEDEIERLFEDCDRGAVPPLGECYGLDVIIDDSIDARRHVYMEGGDHATLIRMEGEQFARLTAKAWRGTRATWSQLGQNW